MINDLIGASEEWIKIVTEIEANEGVLDGDLEQRFDMAIRNMSMVSDQLANTLDYVDTAIGVAKKKKDRYQLKQKQLENYKTKMREIAKGAMLNGMEFAGEDRKVILTNPTKRLNVDEVDLNKLENKDKYTKVVVSLDKAKLKKDIVDGIIDLPEGAKVTEERTLQVR
jgi:hypothetical protein